VIVKLQKPRRDFKKQHVANHTKLVKCEYRRRVGATITALADLRGAGPHICKACTIGRFISRTVTSQPASAADLRILMSRRFGNLAREYYWSGLAIAKPQLVGDWADWVVG